MQIGADWALYTRDGRWRGCFMSYPFQRLKAWLFGLARDALLLRVVACRKLQEGFLGIDWDVTFKSIAKLPEEQHTIARRVLMHGIWT
eukprot:5261948-Alexandrium_andersonii.AAC.1